MNKPMLIKNEKKRDTILNKNYHTSQFEKTSKKRIKNKNITLTNQNKPKEINTDHKKIINNFQGNIIQNFPRMNPSNFFMFQSNMSFFNLNNAGNSMPLDNRHNEIGRQEPMENPNEEGQDQRENIEEQANRPTQDTEEENLSKTKKLVLRIPKNFNF